MTTLEVKGQLVTWPEEFAHLMMKHYRNRGITFIVHRNCIHCGRDAAKDSALNETEREETGAFKFACGYR